MRNKPKLDWKFMPNFSYGNFELWGAKNLTNSFVISKDNRTGKFSASVQSLYSEYHEDILDVWGTLEKAKEFVETYWC